MEGTSYYKTTFFTPVEIDADDYEKGIPMCTIWPRNMYKQLSYAERLRNVHAETLIFAGRHDPEASIQCAEELLQGISNSHLFIFVQSGHFPYIEEAELFKQTLETFLNKGESQ